jgi:hypothetical protein
MIALGMSSRTGRIRAYAVPVYLSVVFGFTRDLWNPFGLRDRGFFLIFAPATAAVFVWMAMSRLSYSGLFIGMLPGSARTIAAIRNPPNQFKRRGRLGKRDAPQVERQRSMVRRGCRSRPRTRHPPAFEDWRGAV